MLKSIFILGDFTPEKIKTCIELEVEAIFVSAKNLNTKGTNLVKKNKIKLFVEVGIFAGDDLWEKYTDCRPINREGKVADKFHWYAGVCPNNQRVRKEKIKLIKSMVEKYSIDGLWLDFIRYPCHWEVPNPDLTEYCFCQICLEKYRRGVGGKQEGELWHKWKADQIVSFVSEVRKVINKSKRNIKLGMFSVPWKEKDYDNAIINVMGQDFKKLSKDIDIFSPMVYHKMCGRSTKWIGETVEYMKKLTQKPILPIVQTENKPEKISKEEFKEEINQAIKEPSSGVIAFFLEDLLSDKDKRNLFVF